MDLDFLAMAFPNTNDREKNQLKYFLEQPNEDCVLDTSAILQYFSFNRPFWMSAVSAGWRGWEAAGQLDGQLPGS